jgi:hypothetical protein
MTKNLMTVTVILLIGIFTVMAVEYNRAQPIDQLISDYYNGVIKNASTEGNTQGSRIL